MKMAKFRLGRSLIAIGAVFVAGLAPDALACSMFAVGKGDQALICDTYDAESNFGAIFTIPPGEMAAALQLEGFQGNPAIWKRERSTVQFSLLKPGFPWVGFNEDGIVFKSLAIDDKSRYPREVAGSKPYINN